MKRKVKKYDDGGKVYDKEDEGLLGGKIKYREEDGRKYVAGNANPFDRNPEEKRYYSMGDVKNKLSGLFGGKKEETAPKEEGTNRFTAAKDNTPDPEKGIAAGFKSSESKFERNDNEKSMPDVKKAAPRKAPPKEEKDAEGVRKSVIAAQKVGSGYEKLDVREKPSIGKDATPMKKEEPKKETKKYGIGPYGAFAGIHKAFSSDDTEEKPAKKSFERKLNTKPTADQMKKMARGGSVKSSASSRGDGCAVRGKTKGRIY